MCTVSLGASVGKLVIEIVDGLVRRQAGLVVVVQAVIGSEFNAAEKAVPRGRTPEGMMSLSVTPLMLVDCGFETVTL
jgi:hypothetical protein